MSSCQKNYTSFGRFVPASVLSLYQQQRNAGELLKITRDAEGDFLCFGIEATFVKVQARWCEMSELIYRCC